VLARVLAPADFGLMATALLVLTTLEVISQTGFETALSRRVGDIRELVDAAFTVQAVRGLLLVVPLWALARPAGAFFGQPDVTAVLYPLGGLLVLRGLVNPVVVHWTRDLQFRRLLLWHLAGAGIELGLAIGFALVYRTVWALVCSVIATQGVMTAASHALGPYRPRLAWRWRHIRELGQFSKWVVGARILMFISLKGDDAFVAKVFGPTALGFYSVAFRITELPMSTVTQIVGRVTLPVFSQLQTEPERLRRLFVTTSRTVGVVTAAAGATLVLGAAPLVRIVLGDDWAPVVVLIRVLAVAAFVRSVTLLAPPLFYAISRPAWPFVTNALRLVVLAAVIYPFAQAAGVTGVALAVLLSLLVTLPVTLAALRSVLGLRGRDYLERPASPWPAPR
jgi:PST family polysaccharide transporter